jgi:hypothetical protein
MSRSEAAGMQMRVGAHMMEAEDLRAQLLEANKRAEDWRLVANTEALKREEAEKEQRVLSDGWGRALELNEDLIAKLVTLRRENTNRPKIVCLCGSTRFKDAFDEANYTETMAGNIVLSVGFFMHASGNKHGESIGATPEQKTALDELHKRKIDLADEVLVLNVGGYIGDSTRSEITHAFNHNKPVRWLEPDKAW